MTAVYVPRYAPKAHGAHLVEDGRQDGDEYGALEAAHRLHVTEVSQ